MRLILLCGALLCAIGLYAQDCTGRFVEKTFTDVSVSTVQFGESVTVNGETQQLFMDIYQPVGDVNTNRPLILFCFGGSFIGGSRDSGELVYFSTELAKRGYVCASIDYRLSGAFDLITEEGAVKTVFRAVQDGKAAVRYFRKNADETNDYNIDPSTIIMGGTSAGAILSMHVAYVEAPEQLPTAWQSWLTELGGLEGNSGNPNYCSKTNGVFSFSGAIGDTSWISNTDVPIYSVHSTDDGIVNYGFGRPLGGNVPVDLYGSGVVTPRMQNLGIYTVLDTYEDDFHPSFQTDEPAETQRRVDTTEKHLVEFLFDILPCNPNNKLPENVEQCESFGTQVVEYSSNTIQNVYPNPTDKHLFIVRQKAERDAYTIVGIDGKIQLEGTISAEKESIDLSQLPTGTYILQTKIGNTKTLFVKR